MKVKKIIAWVVLVAIVLGGFTFAVDRFGFNIHEVIKWVSIVCIATGIYIGLVWAIHTITSD